MKTISKMLPQEATVVRDGVVKVVRLDNLVRGDIVELKMGNRVPADMRLLQIEGLKVDNSMLTGESNPIKCTLHSTSNNFMVTMATINFCLFLGNEEFGVYGKFCA
jgi:sodium/potassium-transporting ATPase subunit alpha